LRGTKADHNVGAQFEMQSQRIGFSAVGSDLKREGDLLLSLLGVGAGDDRGNRSAADCSLFGGDPAIMGAIGMLSGFCGTLTTPMAANFNIVPAALLELPDRYAVIKAQLPTAILLLAANTILMYVLVFRFGVHYA
jgi:hypothetical protein